MEKHVRHTPSALDCQIPCRQEGGVVWKEQSNLQVVKL